MPIFYRIQHTGLPPDGVGDVRLGGGVSDSPRVDGAYVRGSVLGGKPGNVLEIAISWFAVPCKTVVGKTLSDETDFGGGECECDHYFKEGREKVAGSPFIPLASSHMRSSADDESLTGIRTPPIERMPFTNRPLGPTRANQMTIVISPLSAEGVDHLRSTRAYSVTSAPTIPSDHLGRLIMSNRVFDLFDKRSNPTTVRLTVQSATSGDPYAPLKRLKRGQVLKPHVLLLIGSDNGSDIGAIGAYEDEIFIYEAANLVE
ncbi:12137_t:CDS:2 [Acaulospora colombiana]|uniref:12137_t:CDS:1 n=1 Tax=Acaulospora colombiana TaxID=27376 RepID=A0ACA9MMK5_9GLOM|nr:12137_t:CDS:2 [Acaulospora colombiana]